MPPMKFLFQALVLAGVGLGMLTGCITAGGKAVTGLPTSTEAKQGTQITAEEIARRLREAEKAREIKTEGGEVFTFLRDIVVEEFDAEGKIKKRKTRTYRSYSDHRDPVLLMHDGKPPTPEQIKKELKEIQKHQWKILGKGKNDVPNSKGDANLLVRQIEKHHHHFLPRLLGADTIHGRPAYILQFLPNPAEPFDDPIVNLILKQLLIKIWIDQKEFQFAKFDVELDNPLFALGGLAGTVKTFNLTAYQKRLTPEIWADWKVSTCIHIRVLWETHIINFTSESTEFNPLPKTK